jgi:hypothetical protein
MKAKLVAGLIVTWRIAGTVIQPCQPNEKPNPYVGFCVSPLDVTRSAPFDKKADAEQWGKTLKSQKIAGLTLSEVHIYSEEGSK